MIYEKLISQLSEKLKSPIFHHNWYCRINKFYAAFLKPTQLVK